MTQQNEHQKVADLQPMRDHPGKPQIRVIHMSEQIEIQLERLQKDIHLLLEQVTELVKAVHSMAKLQSILNQAVKVKLNGETSAGFSVI